jgi:citrate lyase beta subunit
MKHHIYNTKFKFILDPIEFNKTTEKSILQYCLGATLYMPGTKDILNKIIDKRLTDITSMVMCFEDAIQESDVEKAENNVLFHLDKIADAFDNKVLTLDDIPLLFLRVRNLYQFEHFLSLLTTRQAKALSGFVFPKFHSKNAGYYLQLLDYAGKKHNTMLYGMPILEGGEIAFLETRNNELSILKNILEPYKKLILNIRVGGTDFSSLFGVRRGINYSIYDIFTVRDCLADILNFFTRIEDEYSVSAPVWEYFLADKEHNINNVINNDIHKSLINRTPIIDEAIDGLLREVIIDKANGFIGKTIIHPSHARFVNAMQTVTKEEYDDAMQILNTTGGVIKSQSANKMNEINPHRSWAKKINYRAQAYGVVENDLSFLKLILD